MSEREDNTTVWKIHKLRNKLQDFIDKRQTMSAIDQRKTIKKLNADAKQLYIHAHIENKGDIEKAFEHGFDEMIEIQHHLLMMASF